MTEYHRHRLDGLEPDNLLAFLALLGVLRALEADDSERPDESRMYARACWDVESPPLRPVVVLKNALGRASLLEAICRGVDMLAVAQDFEGRRDLDYSHRESRDVLAKAMRSARANQRREVDLLAALMTDAAIKDKADEIDPTPFCLLYGQGHQHFLDRLAAVPRQVAQQPKRGAAPLSAGQCLVEALFEPWHRQDSTFSFRWDPAEDVRYALMAGDPTDSAYSGGTQHGANRLAAVGLAVLSVAPEVRAGRVRPCVPGGNSDRDGFSFYWPVWRDPASLASIRALLSHPDLNAPERLRHLGVEQVMTARRISVGKFMNFSRGRPVRELAFRAAAQAQAGDQGGQPR